MIIIDLQFYSLVNIKNTTGWLCVCWKAWLVCISECSFNQVFLTFHEQK